MSYETRYQAVKRQQLMKDTPEAIAWRLADQQARAIADKEIPSLSLEEIQSLGDDFGRVALEYRARFEASVTKHRDRILNLGNTRKS